MSQCLLFTLSFHPSFASLLSYPHPAHCSPGVSFTSVLVPWVAYHLGGTETYHLGGSETYHLGGGGQVSLGVSCDSVGGVHWKGARPLWFLSCSHILTWSWSFHEVQLLHLVSSGAGPCWEQWWGQWSHSLEIPSPRICCVQIFSEI